MMSDFINELLEPEIKEPPHNWDYKNVIYALELGFRSLADETLLNLGGKLELWEGRYWDAREKRNLSVWDADGCKREIDGIKKETQDVLDAIDDLVNLKAHYKRVTGKSQIKESK